MKRSRRPPSLSCQDTRSLRSYPVRMAKRSWSGPGAAWAALRLPAGGRSADPRRIRLLRWHSGSTSRYVSPCCHQRCPSPGRAGVDWQVGGTRLHRVAVGSVHRCGCHRLAVLRQCGQTDYREMGAEVHPDFTAAGAGKPGAPRATEPTYRSSVRGEGSTSATGTACSDRTGRRRGELRRPTSRIGAVAPLDGARSRNRAPRDRAAQGKTNVPRHCQGFQAEPAAQDISASAAVGRRAGAQANAAISAPASCGSSHVAASGCTFRAAAT
jgi:hypothetical protein